MKTTLSFIALCLLPGALSAQENTVPPRNTPRNEHSPSLSEVFTLGMQATRQYYFTAQRIVLYPGHTTLRDVYADCQIMALELLRNPIAILNIPCLNNEQYYEILTLILYVEAQYCKRDQSRYPYDRLIEAATLYRMACLINSEYRDESHESTNELLAHFNARAFETEQEAALLLTTSGYLDSEEEVLSQTPENTLRNTVLNQTIHCPDSRPSLLDTLTVTLE